MTDIPTGVHSGGIDRWTPEEEVPKRLADILPAILLPLFHPRFTRSCILYEEYIYRLTVGVFLDSGLAKAAEAGGPAEEIAERAGCEPGRGLVPVRWILRLLASRGVVEAAEPAPGAALQFRASTTPSRPDPGDILKEQQAFDPSWLPAYTLAAVAAQDYPAFLAGKMTGEEVLFSPARLGMWFDYFSNDNGLYAINNRLGAVAAEQWHPSGPASILELGGGLASAAIALLEQFEARGRLQDVREYRFTEMVPAFLRRGQRTLAGRFEGTGALSFARLDMNKSFAEQSVEPARATMVYAVNTLHVAHDLGYTLGQIREALVPGGKLVISECVKPRPDEPIYVEFLFNLMESFRAPVLDPRFRPAGGFLTPEQWSTALETFGFSKIRFLPQIGRVRERISIFYVAAVGATREG